MMLLSLGVSSCSDFLDTVPHNILTPENTWKTETDAEKFLIGCYDKWMDANLIIAFDATSDIAFGNFARTSLRHLSNGGINASNVADNDINLYKFDKIRLCNELIDRIDDINFEDVK